MIYLSLLLLSFVFFAFIALILGLIKPGIVIKWGQEKSRKKVVSVYGLAMFLFLSLSLLTIMLSPSPKVDIPAPIPEIITPINLKIARQEMLEKMANYEIVERWNIPNGGEGKRIIIPAEYQSKEGLMIICNKIENDTRNDRNVYVLGFRDMESLYLEKTCMECDNEGFILNFGKAAKSGYHKCAGYYGTNTAETIIKEY